MISCCHEVHYLILFILIFSVYHCAWAERISGIKIIGHGFFIPCETGHAVLLNIRNIDIIKEKSQGKRAGFHGKFVLMGKDEKKFYDSPQTHADKRRRTYKLFSACL